MLVGTGFGTGKADEAGLHGDGAVKMADGAGEKTKAPSGVLVGVSPLTARAVNALDAGAKTPAFLSRLACTVEQPGVRRFQRRCHTPPVTGA